MEVTFALAEVALKIGRINGGRDLLLKKIKDNEALNKFREMIEYQSGDTKIIDDYKRLPVAKMSVIYPAPENGYIKDIDTFLLGVLGNRLGAGRLKKDDKIDHGCGFRIYKKTGDFVKKGEPLIEIFSDDEDRLQNVLKEMPRVFFITPKRVTKRVLIREIIS
jgi:pyrimidine-nucleoside phosphorylase